MSRNNEWEVWFLAIYHFVEYCAMAYIATHFIIKYW